MKKKKIGICTLYTGYNFGSALQAYATKIVIEKIGYQPEIFKVSGSLIKGRDIRLKKIIILFSRMMLFSNNKLNVIKSFNTNNKTNCNIKTINDFNDFYDNKITPSVVSYSYLKKISKNDQYVSFICGSDQIWNSTAFYIDPFYYLRFCPERKRISYAPSFGRTFVPNYNKKIIKKYLKGIKNISVREQSGKNIVRELINCDADVCLDPTLLINNEEWQDKLKIDTIKDDYIFCYFLNEPSKNARDFVQKVLEKNKNKIIEINSNYFNNSIFGGPETFLSYLNGASVVITDSFHGVAFSINFKKTFYVFDRQYVTENQSTRIKSLLNIVNLEKTFEPNNILEKNYYDYDNVNKLLECERKKSIEFLANNIRSCDINE